MVLETSGFWLCTPVIMIAQSDRSWSRVEVGIWSDTRETVPWVASRREGGGKGPRR